MTTRYELIKVTHLPSGGKRIYHSSEDKVIFDSIEEVLETLHIVQKLDGEEKHDFYVAELQTADKIYSVWTKGDSNETREVRDILFDDGETKYYKTQREAWDVIDSLKEEYPDVTMFVYTSL